MLRGGLGLVLVWLHRQPATTTTGRRPSCLLAAATSHQPPASHHGRFPINKKLAANKKQYRTVFLSIFFEYHLKCRFRRVRRTDQSLFAHFSLQSLSEIKLLTTTTIHLSLIGARYLLWLLQTTCLGDSRRAVQSQLERKHRNAARSAVGFPR